VGAEAVLAGILVAVEPGVQVPRPVMVKLELVVPAVAGVVLI
jgi:hypothetical protein